MKWSEVPEKWQQAVLANLGVAVKEGRTILEVEGSPEEAGPYGRAKISYGEACEAAIHALKGATP